MEVRRNFYPPQWCRWVIENAVVDARGSGSVTMTPLYLNHLAKGVGLSPVHTESRPIPYRTLSKPESKFHEDFIIKTPGVKSERVAMLYLTDCKGSTIDFQTGDGSIRSVPIRAGTLIVHPNLPHRVNSDCQRHILGPFDVGSDPYEMVGSDDKAFSDDWVWELETSTKQIKIASSLEVAISEVPGMQITLRTYIPPGKPTQFHKSKYAIKETEFRGILAKAGYVPKAQCAKKDIEGGGSQPPKRLVTGLSIAVGLLAAVVVALAILLSRRG